MKHLLFCLFAVVFCMRCSDDAIVKPGVGESDTISSKKFIEFLIPDGKHFAIRNDSIVWLNITVMDFEVIFDSSAIYTTADAVNQADINKLYGFSDNEYHQINSARFGWRWYNKELQLHAYVYKQEKRSSKFLKAIPFNQPVHCTIEIRDNQYIFVAAGDTVKMNRGPQQPSAAGYKLFPYFGGDETAPHDIRIKIREL